MNEFCLKEHNLYFYVWMRWRLGEDATKIYDDLCSQIDSLAPTLTCIRSWMRDFDTLPCKLQCESNSRKTDSNHDYVGEVCPVTEKIQTLSPLFCSNGNIKSISLINDFLRSMDDAHILEERYLIIYILYSTDDVQILSEFARCGGWLRLHEWLKYSKEIFDYSFIKELLKLFEKLPLTEKSLVTDDTHQIIESLTKAECHEVRVLSAKVSTTWKEFLEKNTARLDFSQKNKSNKRMSRLQNENGMSVLCDTSPIVTRGSTVKTFKGKTRTVGLEEGANLDSPPPRREDVIRSRQQNLDLVENVLVKPALNASSISLTSFKIPKKSRIESEGDDISKGSFNSPCIDCPSSGDKKRKIDFEEYLVKKGNLIKDPKRIKKSVRPESFGRALLDAESNEKPNASKLCTKRKSKLDDTEFISAEKANTLSSIQSFYQDTLVNQANTDDLESPPLCELEEPSEEVKDDVSAFAAVSPPRLDERDDFESVQDKLEVVEVEEKVKDQRKSNLSEPGIKRAIKKKVCWADNIGSELERIKYFEMDESEKVHHRAYRGDIGKVEMTLERNMRLNMGYGPGGTTSVSYGPLIRIDLPPTTIIPEIKSREKVIQEERQKGILQDIFFEKSLIPDFPSEPEFEPIFDEKKEPVLIPLNDVEETPVQVLDNVTTTASTAVPPGLPPKLADLLARAQKQSQNDGEKTESMLQQIKAFLGQATQSAEPVAPEIQINSQRPVCSAAPGTFLRPPLFMPPPMRTMVAPMSTMALPEFISQPRQPFQTPANPDTPLMQFPARPQANAFNVRGVLPPRLREPLFTHVNHTPRNPRFPGPHVKFRTANRGNRGGWV